jgi:hypothetical protein
MQSIDRDLSSFPASSDTKSKLSAFAFTKPATPQESQIRCADVLIESPVEGSSIPTPSKSIAGDIGSWQIPTPRKTSAIASLKDPPQTPVPRLDISELLRNPEEKLLYPDSQPEDWNEERVTWARSTPGARKPKRCASSSPPPARTPSVKRQYSSSSSAIPSSADPAMELWKKYGGRRYSDESMQRHANPATRLFTLDRVDKSPSNFRRAAASTPEALTGHVWLKRRKTSSFERAREADALTSGDDDTSNGATLTKRSRQARVVSLLDQVKQNMNKSASKPSTLPAFSSASELEENMPPSSPLLAGRPQCLDGPTEAGSLSASIELTEDWGSDYGEFDDADIDMEFIEKVEEIERTTTASQHYETCEEPLLPPARPPSCPAQSPASIEGSPVHDDFNEFDEYDDVFGSIEFEQLVAQYDQPCNDVGDGPRLKRRIALRR